MSPRQRRCRGLRRQRTFVRSKRPGAWLVTFIVRILQLCVVEEDLLAVVKGNAAAVSVSKKDKRNLMHIRSSFPKFKYIHSLKKRYITYVIFS